MNDFDFWMLLAGIGIFLLGIYLMEEAMKAISGKALKNILKKYTSNNFKAITTGTFSTAILQSSSAVTLMVLAFVGAGVLSMSNAIGVILGSNLGTTLTSWIVATIGFKFNIESFALPIIGIGGVGLIFLGKSKRWSNISKLFAGFGLLFLGLDYMKVSVSEFTENFDMSAYESFGLWVYLIIGFVLTAIVQSSSAAIAITLTAVFAGAIDFYSASVMIIGSNMGTTVTVLLGSLGGNINKKRVAVSHFLFNIITGVLALILLIPLNILILDIIGLSEDPVTALALFHTLFNLLGVLVFVPFISLFSRTIVKLIKDKKLYFSKFIHTATTELSDAGLLTIKKEVKYMIHLAMVHNLKILNLDINLVLTANEKMDKNILNQNSEKLYYNLKRIQEEVFIFSSELQKLEFSQGEAVQMQSFLHGIRNLISSCKILKDVAHELEAISDSDQSFTLDHYNSLRRKMMKAYQHIDAYLEEPKEKELENLKTVIQQIEKEEKLFLNHLTKEGVNQVLKNEISSILSANKSFISSLNMLDEAVREVQQLHKEN